MSARFLIHPGYPKTGSTSLQSNVFARHSDLCYLSNHSAQGDAFRDAPQTSEFHALLRDFRSEDVTRINALWRDHMRPAADSERLNVISDETFLGSDGPHDRIAHHLFQLIGPAQVLIVVREQTDILRSLYDMYPWMRADPERRFLPFPNWLEQTLGGAESNIAGVLRYHDVVTLYQEIYGPQAVSVISYGRLFRDPQAQAQLCARLNIDAEEFSRLIGCKPANTAADHSTKKLVRRVLGPIRGSSFLTPGQIQTIRGVLKYIVPDRKTEVGPTERAKIEAFYVGQRIADLPRLGTEGLIL